MFGLGIQELVIILVVALIVIGPKKLPDLARGLGKAVREFRRATDDIKQNFDLDPSDLSPRSKVNSIPPATTEVTKKTGEDKKSQTTESEELKSNGG